MSNALLVFCRERPDIPDEGELEEAPVVYRVRAATPNDDKLVAGQEHHGTFGPDAYVEAGEMPWVVELDFPSSVEFDAFHAGATVLASRSGGGLVYSLPGGKVIEVARPAGPGSKRTVLAAVERAFWTMSHHEDEDEDEDE